MSNEHNDPEQQYIEDLATEWVNSIVPEIYKRLDAAGIHYCEELLCESLSDGFMAGYVAYHMQRKTKEIRNE